MMKDRWNGEIEGLVRRIEDTDWNEVRERWERRVGNVWEKLRRSETEQELERKFKENVLGTEGTNGMGTATESATAIDGKPRILELK